MFVQLKCMWLCVVQDRTVVFTFFHTNVPVQCARPVVQGPTALPHVMPASIVLVGIALENASHVALVGRAVLVPPCLPNATALLGTVVPSVSPALPAPTAPAGTSTSASHAQSTRSATHRVLQQAIVSASQGMLSCAAVHVASTCEPAYNSMILEGYLSSLALAPAHFTAGIDLCQRHLLCNADCRKATIKDHVHP